VCPASVAEREQFLWCPATANIALAIPRRYRRFASPLGSADRVTIPVNSCMNGSRNGVAFDQPVIPTGTWRPVTSSRSRAYPLKRAMAFRHGNFSPYHKYVVTFELFTLPDGRQLAVETTVSRERRMWCTW